MIEQERQEIKSKLIELGFWGMADLGDPVIDRYAADKLHNRIEEKLAPGFAVVSTGFVGNTPSRQIHIVRGEFIYPITVGDTHNEAICLTALLLPEFLRQHPEYASDQQ